MKLLITLDFPPEIGGIQRYLFDIVRFTFSADDRVLAGCVRKPRISFGEVQAKIIWVSTPLSFLNKKFSCIPLFFHFLKIIMTVKNIQEITCGNVYAAVVPWTASFFMRVQYAVYTHGTEIVFLKKRTVRGWIVRKILHKAALLYSNSRYTASLLKEVGIAKEGIIIPPRVVVPLQENNAPAPPKDPGRTAEGKIPQILCVGRLVARKGFATALDALAMLPSDMRWQCVIVGDGPRDLELRAICSGKKIDCRVAFKKRLTDEELGLEFDSSTLFVLPGATGDGVEGFGIVLIEAMVHKVPVIAGRTGAVAEVLDNGVCGVLVEPGDVAGLSRAIRMLLSDAAYRQRLAGAAFERVKRYYAW